MDQTQKDSKRREDAEEVSADVPQGAEVTEGLAEDVDDILDEIDKVLETNAEDFVMSYVQKGGQ